MSVLSKEKAPTSLQTGRFFFHLLEMFLLIRRDINYKVFII